MSPVMEVQLRTSNGFRTAILKLFDQCFGVSRKQHPYNQQAAAAWQDCVRSGLAKRLVDEFQQDENNIRKARFGDTVDDDADDDEEDEDKEESESESESEDDEEDDLRVWEAIIYHRSQKQYEREVRAYSKLKALQGRCIPRFINSVIYSRPGAPTDLPAAYFQVPGILLECIDSFPLSKLTTKVPYQPFLWEKIIESAVDVVREVNTAGVVHHDCQPRNMLVAQRDGAFQLYLIDFAQCAFEEDYKDTEDLSDENGYAHIVHLNDNAVGIAVLMDQRVKRETSYTLRLKTLEDLKQLA
ncbi:protein kinase-like protein [Pochonia chlamydosporia 170]|uniref:Protein kinase-like protein n=1 Tax=Pochonia chlamydosporia 170 TaxID=1380566 RepID=A0A179FFA9_METCM|nr:protein kinase-like protein [Pochonia chlamydosporia 170]OAQ64028.2 protein kinase-like protein [Pochonia chlamydosporia 170]